MRSPVGTLTRSFRNTSTDTPVPFTRTSNGVGTFSRSPGSVPSNTAALLASTKTSGVCYSVVRRTSTATAKATWKLYRKTKKQATSFGDDDNRVEIFDHLALDVLNKPNPFMTRQELFESLEQHVDIVGEGWAVFGTRGQPNGVGGKVPTSIWPVRPDRMQPIPDARTFISGYIYTGPNGEQIPLTISEVMMLRVPDPESLFRGLGPIRSILTTLDSEKYSAEWNRNFFINSAEPGGIIQVPTTLSDDDFDQTQRRWSEQHRGVSKAHRIAVLEGGMTWVPNASNHKDMQFVELHTVSRDVVLEAFGMPGSMIGVSENVNKANAQMGEVTFARWITSERLDRLRDALNNDFLPLFGVTAKDLEFDYVDPTPTDDAAETAALVARGAFVVSMVNAGFDSAEVLETAGLPEMAFEKPETPAPAFHFGTPPPAGQDPNAPDTQPTEDAEDPELVPA